MRSAIAISALAALAAASPMPSGAPSSGPPSGCSENYSGSFEIQVVNVTSSSSKRSVKRDTALVITLDNGVLTDAENRTGYIASNYQFQFNTPVQTNAIYTSGFSVCSNGTLALGDSAIFYQCLSGTFYNLYDESTGAQCNPVYIEVIGDSSSTSATSAAQISSDGQVTATPVPVCQYTDGQPQATGCASAVTQISDGQIQATTGTANAVTESSDGQPEVATSTGVAVSQISDGQIQATTGANASYATATPSIVAATGSASTFTLGGSIVGLVAGVFGMFML